jgi:hypothetical protein
MGAIPMNFLRRLTGGTEPASRPRRRTSASWPVESPANDALPQNAWGIVVRRRRITLHAGSAVERADGFLAEGAWAGAYSAEGILSSPFRCGSGIVRDRPRIVLFGPSHSTEHIYCFVGRGYLAVSNAVHLAVALARGAKPADLGAARRSSGTVRAGCHHYDRILYTTRTGTMLRLAFGMWTIDQERLSLTETGHPVAAIRGTTDYAGYRADLLETLRSIVENARDPRRRAPYGDIVTTCSAGYDSPACAALARDLGCREALSLRTARGGGDDSGRAVAASLGLACIERERFGAGLERAGEQGGHLLDAAHLSPAHDEFLGSLNTPEDLWIADFAPHLPGRILFTGFHGDKVWSKGCPSGPMIVRGDNSGSGIDEFRKRVGFVHVPVPFIGASDHAGLAALFGAEEMLPYRVGGTYDRPVPRRIAEDAGVPRGLFGQEKRAGSVLIAEAGPRRQAAFDAMVGARRAAVAPRTDPSSPPSP